MIIMPSRPIFTTPERSENKPPRAAIAIGTDNKRAEDAVPTLVKSEALVIALNVDNENTIAKA